MKAHLVAGLLLEDAIQTFLELLKVWNDGNESRLVNDYAITVSQINPTLVSVAIMRNEFDLAHWRFRLPSEDILNFLQRLERILRVNDKLSGELVDFSKSNYQFA